MRNNLKLKLIVNQDVELVTLPCDLSAVLVRTKFSGEKMGQLFIQRTTSKMQQTSIYDINPPTSLRVNIEVRGDPGEAGTLVHSHRPQSDLAHQCTVQAAHTTIPTCLFNQ